MFIAIAIAGLVQLESALKRRGFLLRRTSTQGTGALEEVDPSSGEDEDDALWVSWAAPHEGTIAI